MIDNKYLNKIVYGDAYQEIKNIQDKSVDLIIVDPPYKLRKTHSSIGKHPKGQCANNLQRELASKGLDQGINMSICDDFMRVMKRPNIYIWCNKAQILEYLQYFVGMYQCAFEIMVWCKTNPIPLYGRNYMNDKEFCLYFRKGVSLHTTYETGKTYWVSPTNVADKRLYGHPTIKPEWIIDQLILNSSSEGAVVLDCFLGSGTTAVCAKRLKRHYIGIENDPEYHAMAINRLELL